MAAPPRLQLRASQVQSPGCFSSTAGPFWLKFFRAVDDNHANCAKKSGAKKFKFSRVKNLVTAKIAGFWLFWANFDLQAFFMAWEMRDSYSE